MLRSILLILILLVSGTLAYSEACIVAASNSTPQSKARADVVCDGVDDQMELMASLNAYASGQIAQRHSVKWLPGDYYLTTTARLAPTVNVTIEAEGTCLHYQPGHGDAVHIQGMVSSRYRFGNIDCKSDGAAIRVQNKKGISALMSIVSFGSLIGQNQQGFGLHIDVAQEGVCTNRFEGLLICGFDTGIYMSGVPNKTHHWHKNDTNWFYINYIKDCNTGIKEMPGKHGAMDDHVYRLGLDTSLPGSVGMRIRQHYGRYDVTIADTGGVNTKAFVIEPDARGNVLEITPSVDTFDWENKALGSINVILSATRKPYSNIPESK